jgi:hypothetical protein
LRESEILLYQETLYISGLQVLYKRRLWKWASFSIGALLGKLEGGFVYRGLRETVKEGSGTGASLAVWGLCEGNLEGGLLYWGPWRVYKERLWRRAFLSIGATLGNLEGRFFIGDFERQ